jgi:hypothetical protein
VRNPVNAGPAAPAAPAEVRYSAAERDEAKAEVCDAFTLVSVGVGNSSALQLEGQDNVGVALAVAANARLALLGGGQFLLDRVAPATPNELAEAARAFGRTLMDVGIAAIAEVPGNDPAQTQRLEAADRREQEAGRACNPEGEHGTPARAARPGPRPAEPMGVADHVRSDPAQLNPSRPPRVFGLTTTD